MVADAYVLVTYAEPPHTVPISLSMLDSSAERPANLVFQIISTASRCTWVDAHTNRNQLINLSQCLHMNLTVGKKQTDILGFAQATLVWLSSY